MNTEHAKIRYTLHLSSEHADEYLQDQSGPTTSGYRVNLEGSILKDGPGFENSRMNIQLTHAEIPNTWYNIDANNNQFLFYDNEVFPPTFNTPSLYLLKDGHYDNNTLATSLQTLLNANTKIGATYIVQYDEAAHSYLIEGQHTVNFNFTLSFVSNKSVAFPLGFERKEYNSFTYGTNQLIISPNSTQLSRAESVYVTTSLNIKNVYHPRTSGVSNVLAKIPVKIDKKQILYFEQSLDHALTIEEDQVSFLQLELVNEYGDLINLNGHHWTCTVILTIYPIV
jgi:hypothetical protein